MNPQNLYELIVDYCRKHENPMNVIKYSRYFKEGYDAWGLSQTEINDFVKKLIKKSDLDLHLIFQTMPLLMKSGKYEETSIGLLLINGLKKQYSDQILSKISELFISGIRNWAHADTLGMWIIPAIIEKSYAKEEDLVQWLTSHNSFQRRCVPVTFIKSLKRLHSPLILFEIIESLMTDTVREVQQGTGWFLREAWKKFPLETEEFLKKHKNSSPRLIYQYACEKMPKDQKEKFRKNSKS